MLTDTCVCKGELKIRGLCCWIALWSTRREKVRSVLWQILVQAEQNVLHCAWVEYISFSREPHRYLYALLEYKQGTAWLGNKMYATRIEFNAHLLLDSQIAEWQFYNNESANMCKNSNNNKKKQETPAVADKPAQHLKSGSRVNSKASKVTPFNSLPVVSY